MPSFDRSGCARTVPSREAGRGPAAASAPGGKLDPRKRALIDYAGRRFSIRSFVDLGGVWNVAGAYSFYALEALRPARAWLVDWQMPGGVRERAEAHPALSVEQGYFSDRRIRERIGHTDALILFDVLLHQVDPDWQEVLSAWAEIAGVLLVFNPQWTGERTVRLLDLGEKGYFDNVPHRHDEAPYDDLFAKLEDPHPIHGRPWKDAHPIWQWGITDQDLIACAEGAGFRLGYFADWGRFGDLPHFENHAFAFNRS